MKEPLTIKIEMEKNMKKKLGSMIALGICAATLVTGCASGSISNDKITIKKYKGLEVEKVVADEVTEQDIEYSIQSTLETLATSNEITDRPCQEGDVIVYDFCGKLDGVAFDGGTAENQTLELGSGVMIPGFEEGIIGHSTGETFDIDVTFPEEYQNNPDMAGAETVFTITIHKITEVIVPELTEELLPEISKTATTLDEFRAEVKEDLEVSNAATAESQLEQKVWTALIAQCEVKEFAEDVLNAKIEEIETQMSAVAAMYGMETDAFVEAAYGQTIEEMAKTTITQEYAIELIADKENISITLEAYEEGLAKYASQYGYTDPEEFEELYGEETIKEVLMKGAIAEFLMENCKQVEAK